MLAVDAFGDRLMEGFVQPEEAGVVAGARGGPLPGDDGLEVGDAPGVGLEGGLSGDRDLDGLAHEAEVLDVSERDHLHEGAALGPDLDETDLAELDEGLADRLARHAKLAGDFCLAQWVARPKLQLDDGLLQRLKDPDADGLEPWLEELGLEALECGHRGSPVGFSTSRLA